MVCRGPPRSLWSTLRHILIGSTRWCSPSSQRHRIVRCNGSPKTSGACFRSSGSDSSMPYPSTFGVSGRSKGRLDAVLVAQHGHASFALLVFDGPAHGRLGDGTDRGGEVGPAPQCRQPGAQAGELSRRNRDVAPLKRLTIAATERVGSAATNRCTWSGITSPPSLLTAVQAAACGTSKMSGGIAYVGMARARVRLDLRYAAERSGDNVRPLPGPGSPVCASSPGP